MIPGVAMGQGSLHLGHSSMQPVKPYSHFEGICMSVLVRLAAVLVVVLACARIPASTQPAPQPAPAPAPAPVPSYSSNEVIDAGHRFFGTVSRGLAQIVERAGSQFGLPNGYIFGQESGGALIGGM